MLDKVESSVNTLKDVKLLAVRRRAAVTEMKPAMAGPVKNRA